MPRAAAQAALLSLTSLLSNIPLTCTVRALQGPPSSHPRANLDLGGKRALNHSDDALKMLSDWMGVGEKCGNAT